VPPIPFPSFDAMRRASNGGNPESQEQAMRTSRVIRPVRSQEQPDLRDGWGAGQKRPAPPMVASMRAVLAEMQVPDADIRAESFLG
jgi:hypothetical protein